MSVRDVPHLKIGAGHAQAMWRLGLAELRQAAAHPGSNVTAPTEYGLYGTRTPQEVLQERMAESQLPDEKPSILGEHVMQAEAAAERQDREPPEPEHEKE